MEIQNWPINQHLYFARRNHDRIRFFYPQRVNQEQRREVIILKMVPPIANYRVDVNGWLTHNEQDYIIPLESFMLQP